jgi:hypothetical protein
MRMKMIALIPAVLCLGNTTAAPQKVEHAPTAAQCQADEALWMSQLEAEHGLDRVTVSTLVAWEHPRDEGRGRRL